MKTQRRTPLRLAALAVLVVTTRLVLDTSFVLAWREGPQQGPSVYAELNRVPEKARAKRNPFEGDSKGIAAGKKLFAQHCAECHGDQGQGSKRGPSLRAEEVQQAPPGALFWTLSNGIVRRGMPDWSKLPEPERWQIVTYIYTLK
jgi:mono/diheme cytochrome c family protein